MATQILNNCHFDAEKIKELYIASKLEDGSEIEFPLDYNTQICSVSSIISYSSWTDANVVTIGTQNLQFWEVFNAKENITFTEELIIDQRGRNYVKTITFELSGLNQTLIDQLELLVLTRSSRINPSKIVAIVIDENDNELIVGYDFPLILENLADTINEETNNIVLTFTSSSQSRSRNLAEYRSCLFGLNNGLNDTVAVVKTLSDQKLMIGGAFTEYDGYSVSCITRLYPNGCYDDTFKTGTFLNTFTGSTYRGITNIVEQPDGKYIIGGRFTLLDGYSQNYITRLNNDGSRDTSFEIGSGFDIFVRDIALQADGKILVGGYFQSFSGISINRLARLNSDGSLDTTFNIGTGFNGTVSSIAVQSDQKIVVGGYFTTFSGMTAKYIIRLNTDGSKDATFDTGTGVAQGFSNTVFDVAIQPDGKIIAVGNFWSYNDNFNPNAVHIIRLNTDGTIDGTFNIGAGFNLNGSVPTVIKILSDGKIVITGGFTTYQGTPCESIIRLNSDASIDCTFGGGPTDGFPVYDCVAEQQDGKLIIGSMSLFDGQPVNQLIRVNTDCTLDTCE